MTEDLFGSGVSVPRRPHQAPASNAHDEHLTPPWLIQSVGPFDLDPCAPIKRPWPTAKHHYTVVR